MKRTKYFNFKLRDERPVDENFVPNSVLISQLFNALADHDAQAKEYKANEEQLGIPVDTKIKIDVILKALPSPIEKQVRRLIVVGDESEGARFFDKLDLKRLRQLVLTYRVTIELVAVTFISQLLKLFEQGADFEIYEPEARFLESYFLKPEGDKEATNYAALIRTVRLILSRNEVKYFIEELDYLGQQYQGNADLAAAVGFFEDIRWRLHQDSVRENEAAYLCQQSEKFLAFIFSQLGFLANYKVLSIWDIDVYKYRHIPEARYMYPTIDNMPKNFIMDRRSVLLSRHDVDGKYLNLSPFMIDANAFVKRDTVSSMARSTRTVNRFMVFNRYSVGEDDYHYHEMHKPNRVALKVSNDIELKVLQFQFEEFFKLILKKSLKQA